MRREVAVVATSGVAGRRNNCGISKEGFRPVAACVA